MPSEARLSHQSLGRVVETALLITVREAIEQHMEYHQTPLYPASLEDVKISFRHVSPASSADLQVSIILDGRYFSKRFKHVDLTWKRNLVL